MKNQRSLFGSLSLLACGLLAAGCMDSAQPTAEENSQVINQTVTSAMSVQSQMTFKRSSQGESMQVNGEGWTQSAPGIWQNGDQKLIAGVEGHKNAIAQTEQQLASLRDRLSTDPRLAQLIAQSEQSLESLKEASKDPGPSPQVTCNIGFLLGPSSPNFGTVGAVAASLIDCLDGCVQFTSQAQACTDFGCSPVVAGTAVVCTGSPWLFGVVTPGTAGFPQCSAAAFVSPPGIGGSWVGACG